MVFFEFVKNIQPRGGVLRGVGWLKNVPVPFVPILEKYIHNFKMHSVSLTLFSHVRCVEGIMKCTSNVLPKFSRFEFEAPGLLLRRFLLVGECATEPSGEGGCEGLSVSLFASIKAWSAFLGDLWGDCARRCLLGELFWRGGLWWGGLLCGDEPEHGLKIGSMSFGTYTVQQSGKVQYSE